MINNDKLLLEKIEKLEERVKTLEDKLSGDKQDVKFEEVVKLISRYDAISCSMLQRRLGIGYARSARILDELEDKGYIAVADGVKPRKVIKQRHV